MKDSSGNGLKMEAEAEISAELENLTLAALEFKKLSATRPQARRSSIAKETQLCRLLRRQHILPKIRFRKTASAPPSPHRGPHCPPTSGLKQQLSPFFFIHFWFC